MVTPHQRIERQKSTPALVRLHHALSRLCSTVTIMHTGAHPDDEQSGLMAWLRFGLGIRVIIACSTRGEGGQNALGPDRGGALGLVRTREMEEAARVLDCDVVWLGHGPEDTVHDFGFSKDGDRTFDRWGEMRTVERLVRAYRSERPDIVLPTFLDVPGQHGHHRAMTRAAEKAIILAADSHAFPEHFAEGLQPWKVAKYYLPAWSGGGETYDDEVPPPETTVTVQALGRDSATGADYDRIGEWSRYYHASQGMGFWPDRPKKEWPLHLLLSERGSCSEASILEGLPSALTQLADLHALPKDIQSDLNVAQNSIDKAIASFPDREAIINSLVAAAVKIDDIRATAPTDFLLLHDHRLLNKKAEINTALIEAAAILDRAALVPAVLTPRDEATLLVELNPDHTHYNVRLTPVFPEGVTSLIASSAPDRQVFTITTDDDIAYTPLYARGWSALGGSGEAYVTVHYSFSGYEARTDFDLEEAFTIIPASSVTIEPEALIVPLKDDMLTEYPIDISIKGLSQPMQFTSEGGWSVEQSVQGAMVKAPEKREKGLFRLLLRSAGQEALHLTPITYPHIGSVIHRQPEILNILSLDLKLPAGARIGYIGGGADRVGMWLTRMGLDVTELEPRHLNGDLSQFTTIVVGIFAFGLRKDLSEATAKLHDFVENGGHLITLYHRPSDGWNPTATPPRKLHIGTPSLRWRVTDAAAEVTILAPQHILLNGPNMIQPEDWQGWDKERGLYFASRWDEAYQPLLSMHDVNEQPLTGALLSAAIGAGRHTHTSLALHHQMDRLVPGAFRLMANLVQSVRRS